MTDLDALIERARSATVERSAAERYVRELEIRERERAAPRPRRWVPWLAAGFAAAAAVVALLWLRGGAPGELGAPLPIGARVAIVAEPGTSYRVVRADADGTAIAVERGAVTARLWPGARPHHLVLSGGGIAATATGTVYSLAIRDTGPVVSVVEGTVEVRADGAVHAVHAAQTWPPDGPATSPAAGRVLLALPQPPAVEALATDDAGAPTAGAAANGAAAAGTSGEIADDAGTVASEDGSAAAGGSAAASAGDAAILPGVDSNGAGDTGAGSNGARAAPAAPPKPRAPVVPTIKDRWHTARLLHGQGKFTDAVTACLEIADQRDATWSPIALIEAVRIELGPLADPDRAIALADRMLRDWPANALAPEARELRCRALRQLGRGDACGAAPRP
jgi:hypothetical protein